MDRLAPTDRLAIVTYDDEVQLRAPLAAVDHAALAQAIDHIQAGGSTNLSGGWLKATEVLRGATGDGPRRILLLTDGLANVGIVDRAHLASMAGQAAEQDVGTTTIGFGDGFDEDLLTRMADAGRGNAHFAATPDDAPGIFAQEFEGLLSLVAQNLSVEIRPTRTVQVLGILNEYPQVPVEGGVQVQLGDAYADERRRVVFRLHVPRVASLGVAKVAEVVIRYASVGEQVALHEVVVPMQVNLVSADEAAATGPDAEVTEEVVVLESARAQEQAIERADAGDFDGAREVLNEAAERLRKLAPGSSRADELIERAERLGEHEVHMFSASYSPEARKELWYDRHATRRGRPRKRGPP